MSPKVRKHLQSEIQEAVFKKVSKKKVNKRSKHPKVSVELEGKQVFTVKIPNMHNNTLPNREYERIAKDLRLDMEEFDQLISCKISGTKYMELLSQRISLEKN